MKSIVELEIDVPQARAAELYSDPENTTKWMDDVKNYEPLSGEPGMPARHTVLCQSREKWLLSRR